jgi:formylglycine-generating enzyme required for sulfatase activity
MMYASSVLRKLFVSGIATSLCVSPSLGIHAQDDRTLTVKNSDAKTQEEMKTYVELIEHSNVKIEMLPIPGGVFKMGSTESEAERGADEGPEHEVSLSPFWMAKTEITWDAYDIWMSDLDVFNRDVNKIPAGTRDDLADKYQKSQPTKPYCDMSFGMGTRGFPAICMTQHAARTYCKWLSAKTGRYYRLPTEAEWEYACRAGTTTAYSFGDEPSELGDHAWFADNSSEKYQRVGKKKPNPWGLHDMHGNVAEWVLDQHDPAGYLLDKLRPKDPLFVPATLYPRVVRGGGWNSTPQQCRSAAREGSTEDWIAQDPQFPVSIWYLTDALHVGFRIVRPLNEPTQEEKDMFWDYSEPIQKERPVPLER